MAAVATDFEKIIHTARERKKNEALADKIFSTSRRQPKPKPAIRGSLASRVGVKKPQQQTRPPPRQRASIPSRGDVNGEWTHDLHNAHDRSPKGPSLRSRISHPSATHNANANFNAAPRSNRKRAVQLSSALDRMDDTDGPYQRQTTTTTNTAAAVASHSAASGISIRGLAGPFAVLAQNFAPGTTAADIESAMTPVGGEMVSCTVIKTQPMILVEMVFLSREGGERVIQTFHNKTADGRVIQVFAKPGGYQPEHNSRNGTQTRSTDNNSSSSSNNYHSSHNDYNSRDHIVDGRNGFSDDLMAADDTAYPGNDRLFYIDKAAPMNRRGRGFQRSQGSR